MPADARTSPDWIERAYLALYQLLPTGFRQQFGAEMLEFFRVSRAAVRTQSLRARITFGGRAVADVIAAAWRERWQRPVVTGPARPMFATGIRDDIRAAARRLRRMPSLPVMVIGLLALTIGSATVVFGVVNAVLLRPLPYPNADRIVLIWETRANVRENNVGAHEYPVWVRRNRSFSDMAAVIYNEGVHVTEAGEPKAILGVRVAEPFFRVMGVQPAIGRAFTRDEDTPGRGRVAVISDRLWRERFGADAAAIGRRIVLDGQPHQIVGVMPPGFAFPPARARQTPDVWVPIAENVEPMRGRHFLWVFGRLKDGTSVAQADADMSAIAAAIAKELPEWSEGHSASVMPLQDHLVRDVRPSLMLLLGAVGCLLLIGCSNVASLLLARGLVRRREISLELALGATRWRVARQLFAESLVMSVTGGALGLILAVWLTHLVPSLVPPDQLSVEAISVDPIVLYFALAVSILTGLLFGIAPAIQLRRVDPAQTLARGGRSIFGGRHTRARRVLVVVQIALAVLLVLGATLMARGLVALRRVDPGFETRNTLTADVTLRGPRYASAVQQRQFFDDVETQARTIPGVTAVGAINEVPLGGGIAGIAIGIEGANRPAEGGSAQYRVVSPGYFKTMGVRFVAGRDFAASDARLAVPLIRWWPQQPLPDQFNAPQPMPVAVINESMARAYWPTGALDRRFTVIASPPITVIGVVADMRTVSLRAGTGPEFYLTSVQEPQTQMSLLVRGSDTPLSLAPAVRSVINRVDPALPIGRIEPMDDVVAKMFDQPTFMSTLLGVFGGLALLLMTVGVYGLLAFTTAQRLPEIGVRVALGAGRGQIRFLILRDAFALTMLGVAGGVAAGLALGRFIEGELYGITPTDRMTYVVVITVVSFVVALACWRPARIAARVDPVVILRQD
jgi:putative ABC transport system permease protein